VREAEFELSPDKRKERKRGEEGDEMASHPKCVVVQLGHAIEGYEVGTRHEIRWRRWFKIVNNNGKLRAGGGGGVDYYYYDVPT
jgi:hypothetical protein